MRNENRSAQISMSADMPARGFAGSRKTILNFARKLFAGIKRHKNLMRNFVIFKIFPN